jgi:hypothetical protein
MVFLDLELSRKRVPLPVYPRRTESISLKSFNTKTFVELTKAERLRRHNIFRSLVAQIRGEYVKKDSLNGFVGVDFELPNLQQSRNFGLLEYDELYRLGICSVPNFILNALVCRRLTEKFGDLSICGCFRSIIFGQELFWRLDVDEKLSRSGLLMPVRSHTENLIYGLNVFRYPDDQRPFMLKVRS